MRISRVHTGAELVVGEEISLDKFQSHYLKHVLRLKSGAALLLFNGREAVDYHASLVFEGKRVSARIDTATPLNNESGLDSEIMQGLGRADHMDWIIQKTTELGVNRISLFNAERTQSPLKPAQLEKKLAHWRGVAISACEQSGRALLPQLDFHASLDQAVAASIIEIKLLLDFDGDALTSALQSPSTAVSILLGPSITRPARDNAITIRWSPLPSKSQATGLPPSIISPSANSSTVIPIFLSSSAIHLIRSVSFPRA
jgi:16S rRNA (uracil1498-N3)-methyltransferase